MAKLDRYGADTGKSAEMATEWTVASRLDISDSAIDELELLERTQYLTVYSDLAFYARFDNATGDNNVTTTDPIYPASVLLRIKVPRGQGTRGDSVFFHVKATTSSGSKFMRVVQE